MRTTLVYDLPTRIFHWCFSGLFLLSFVIAKNVDDESIVFIYHMLSGLLLGGLVIWRVVWGFIGEKHARFSGFNLNPLFLNDYFLGILSGTKKRWSGHNPASSWAAIAMLSLALGLSVTGYLMSTGNKETYEDLHEILANSFIIVVGLHVAGIILHSIRFQDAIGMSMIDGKKETSESGEAIPTSRRFAAAILIALVISGGLYLYKMFDTQNRSLSLFGQVLQLGENENEENMNSDALEKNPEGEEDDE